ncbi:hypothetical protein [Methanosarcina siciliae]|nr:hypothetical protein [Methanosarcina siciliae]
MIAEKDILLETEFQNKVEETLDANKKYTDFSGKHVKNHIYERSLS